MPDTAKLESPELVHYTRGENSTILWVRGWTYTAPPDPQDERLIRVSAHCEVEDFDFANESLEDLEYTLDNDYNF